MAIKVKKNFIIENVIDENGNKIGEIKFNPNDSRIMSKLVKIVNDLNEALDKLKSMGDIPEIPKEKLETLEDFEKVSDIFKTINTGFRIEENAVNEVFKDLTEVFGENTINLFTGGAEDILSIMPLIEYVMPYVKAARETKINKYIKNTTTDVME